MYTNLDFNARKLVRVQCFTSQTKYFRHDISRDFRACGVNHLPNHKYKKYLCCCLNQSDKKRIRKIAYQ